MISACFKFELWPLEHALALQIYGSNYIFCIQKLPTIVQNRFFLFVPPTPVAYAPPMSACHYIVNHYEKIWHVRLGDANNMHPLSIGGGGGLGAQKKRSEFSLKYFIFLRNSSEFDIIHIRTNTLPLLDTNGTRTLVDRHCYQTNLFAYHQSKRSFTRREQLSHFHSLSELQWYRRKIKSWHNFQWLLQAEKKYRVVPIIASPQNYSPPYGIFNRIGGGGGYRLSDH